MKKMGKSRAYYGPMLRALLCVVLTIVEASTIVVALVKLASFAGALELFWVREVQLYDCIIPLLVIILLLAWACWELNVRVIMWCARHIQVTFR